MRIILVVLIPFFLGLLPSNVLDKGTDHNIPEALVNTDSLTANASFFFEEFCDYKTTGQPVAGIKAKMVELGSGNVMEDISDSNGDFTLCKPADGLISYEGELSTRFYTDAHLSNPVIGISTFDIVKIGQLYVGNQTLCPYSRFGADVNQDGMVDTLDTDVIRQLILGTFVFPFPYDVWRLVPKLPSVPGMFHPDQEFLADYWNSELVQNLEAIYPFVAELDLQGDHYVYQGGACSFIGKIKAWDYREDIDGCSPNSFDFYVGKAGDSGMGVNPVDLNILEGLDAAEFGIRCSTPQDERYLEVIPFGTGFVGAGHAISSNPSNGQDMLVVRMNRFGEPIWSKTIGGSGAESAYSVLETSDGNLFVSGYTGSISTDRQDIFFLKLNASNGDVIWEKGLEASDLAAPFSGAYAYSIETSDGGFILGGRTNRFGAGYSDFYVTKVDGSGNLTWSKTYGGYNNDWIRDIIQTQDGGYLIAGVSSTYRAGFHDILMVKINASGIVEWERNIGTTDNDTVGKVIELANGHFILTGSFGKDNTYNTANANAVVMELENNGDIVWSMGYTGQGLGRDLAYEVVPVSGGYLVLGRSNSFDTAGEFDAMVWKINTTGSLLWAKQYGENGKDDGFFTISEVNANEFVLGGFTKFPGQDTDLFYQKMDASGSIYAPYLCIQSVPNLVFDAQSTLIDDSNVAISDVSAAVAVNFTSADYNTDCYQVCVTGGGAASITSGGNNASLRVNSEKMSLEKGKTKKARVSITTKKPIQGFGFGMSLDNSKFSISNINLIEDGSPLDVAMNKTASSLAAGQVKIIGMMKDYTKELAVDCSNPRPIFEMEGVFKETSNTQELINLREELVKLEFVADGELLSPEEFEIIVDWAN